jgi:hypothetical protein
MKTPKDTPEARDYLTPSDLVDRYKRIITEQTLRNWRYANRGPKYDRIGGRILYRLRDVEQWEEKRAVSTRWYK